MSQEGKSEHSRGTAVASALGALAVAGLFTLAWAVTTFIVGLWFASSPKADDGLTDSNAHEAEEA